MSAIIVIPIVVIVFLGIAGAVYYKLKRKSDSTSHPLSSDSWISRLRKAFGRPTPSLKTSQPPSTDLPPIRFRLNSVLHPPSMSTAAAFNLPPIKASSPPQALDAPVGSAEELLLQQSDHFYAALLREQGTALISELRAAQNALSETNKSLEQRQASLAFAEAQEKAHVGSHARMEKTTAPCKKCSESHYAVLSAKEEVTQAEDVARDIQSNLNGIRAKMGKLGVFGNFCSGKAKSGSVSFKSAAAASGLGQAKPQPEKEEDIQDARGAEKFPGFPSMEELYEMDARALREAERASSFPETPQSPLPEPADYVESPCLQPEPDEDTWEGRTVALLKESLLEELKKFRVNPIDQRRTAFKQLRMRWHPDKCPENPQVAKRVFQWVEGLKPWFLL